MTLPDYIDTELFQEWIEWRKESSRQKLSPESLERIVKLGIGKLERLKDQGYDPNLCIENTIFNQWKGFFPYDRNQASNSVHGKSLSRADEARAEIDRLFGTDGDAESGHAEIGQLRIVK